MPLHKRSSWPVVGLVVFAFACGGVEPSPGDLGAQTEELGPAAVVTSHQDNARTGAKLDETRLTHANVRPGTFGHLFSRAVDGAIYAQPLYVPGVFIAGVGTRDVVYVVTETNNAYAFDADNPAAAAPLWHRSFGPPATSAQLSCGNISPTVGITSTPVIDLAAHALYLVAKSKENGNYLQRLHAVDLRSGAELRPPVVIAGSVAGSGYDAVSGRVIFSPFHELNRPALLLAGGLVYIAFSSHCDGDPYHGWIMAYDAATFTQRAIYNVTPDGGQGGIWMSGQGLASDGTNVYGMTGNGTFTPNGRDLGNSFVKLTAHLELLDWFTPHNQAQLNADDADLGSAGLILLPNTNLLVGGGKSGILFLLNRSNLGRYRSTDDNQVVQRFAATRGPIFNSPVYWQSPAGGRLYVWSAGDVLRAFAFNGSRFDTTPAATGTISAPRNGAALTVSANGSAAGTGIVWAAEPLQNALDAPAPGILRAFDAENVAHELWNSNQSAADALGNHAKFSPPLVANGRVYAATSSGKLQVYGLH